MSDAQIQTTLGKLLEKVEGLEKSNAKAEGSRKVLHNRMDQLHFDVAMLQRDMTDTREKVAEQGEITDEVRRWKHMGIGALGIVGIGGTAVGAALWASIEKLGHFFRG